MIYNALCFSLFAFFMILVFKNVKLFKETDRLSEAKKVTQQQMAARFIDLAIAQHRLKSSPPSLVVVKKFEELSSAQHDLVEEYNLRISEAIESGLSKGNGTLRVVA